jgi:hypothetical protein
VHHYIQIMQNSNSTPPEQFIPAATLRPSRDIFFLKKSCSCVKRTREENEDVTRIATPKIRHASKRRQAGSAAREKVRARFGLDRRPSSSCTERVSSAFLPGSLPSRPGDGRRRPAAVAAAARAQAARVSAPSRCTRGLPTRAWPRARRTRVEQ